MLLCLYRLENLIKTYLKYLCFESLIAEYTLIVADICYGHIGHSHGSMTHLS